MRIWTGDARSLPLADGMIDTICTDPPYGLSFMGKAWDHSVPGPEFWREALRVAKPGCWIMAFGGPRTWHRLACAIEDAGWEIRDCISWIYATGFPKSYDIGKGIDRARDEDCEPIQAACLAIQAVIKSRGLTYGNLARHFGVTARMVGHWAAPNAGNQPSLPTAEQWAKLRSLLGVEPSGELDAEVSRLIGRKGEPGVAWSEREIVGSRRGKDAVAGDLFSAGAGEYITKDFDITAPATEAAQLWDGYGTALKPAWEPIILARAPLDGTNAHNALTHGAGGLWIEGARIGAGGDRASGGNQGSMPQPMDWGTETGRQRPAGGRWPSNLILDEEAGAMLDEQGGGSRFFYCPKPSKAERNAGLTGPGRKRDESRHAGDAGTNNPYNRGAAPVRNPHPTVKPVALLRHLLRLTRPPSGGLVLDPFMGSGSTGVAAVLEGREFIGVDISAEYCELARARIAHARSHPWDYDPELPKPPEVDPRQQSIFDTIGGNHE